MDLEQRITAIAEPLALSLGLHLWGVQVLLGPRSVVRVFAEGDAGISIDQCADLSRLLGLSLEVEDFLEAAYVLEVSSPGLERIYFTQEQLTAAAGQNVVVTLAGPVSEYPGRRKFAGTLLRVAEGTVHVEDNLTGVPLAVALPWASVKKVRASFVEPEKAPPGKAGKTPAKKSPKGASADACSIGQTEDIPHSDR